MEQGHLDRRQGLAHPLENWHENKIKRAFCFFLLVYFPTLFLGKEYTFSLKIGLCKRAETLELSQPGWIPNCDVEQWTNLLNTILISREIALTAEGRDASQLETLHSDRPGVNPSFTAPVWPGANYRYWTFLNLSFFICTMKEVLLPHKFGMRMNWGGKIQDP